MSLAALNLRDLKVDPGVLGWILGFWDSVFHLNSRILAFCINVTFCVNCVGLNVDVALSTSIT